MSISSSLVQQLARPVPAAVVDLVPLVQGGCCRSEHDEELLLKAQAAHPRGWVVAACPCQYLPGDGVRVALVFKLPHVGRESGRVFAFSNLQAGTLENLSKAYL